MSQPSQTAPIQNPTTQNVAQNPATQHPMAQNPGTQTPAQLPLTGVMTTRPTTPPTGAGIATGLVAQVQAMPTWLSTVCDGDALPPALRQVRDQLTSDQGTPVWTLLLRAIYQGIAPRNQFDFANGAWSADRDKAFRGMASGGAENAFDLPGLDLTGFFADLFGRIANALPNTKINEMDLFHGHVVPHEAGRDVVILFHTKEYPTGSINAFATQRLQNNNLLSGATPFNSTGSAMDRRNLIWTLRTNRVFLLDGHNRTDQRSDFRKLMILTGQLLQEQEQMGTVQEQQWGAEQFTVNYFPLQLGGDHRKQVFFAPVGPWFLMRRLQVTYPNVPLTQIEAWYEDTDRSAVQTENLLKLQAKYPLVTFDAVVALHKTNGRDMAKTERLVATAAEQTRQSQQSQQTTKNL